MRGDSHVILETVLQSNGTEVPDSVLFTILPIFVLVVGGIFWYAGARGPILRARQFLGMESFDPHEKGGDGLVAIEGTVESADGFVTAPISGVDCVAYDKADQQWRHSYKYNRRERRRLKRKGIDEELADQNGWSWDTTNSERDSVPFRVETEHGSVSVDPVGAKRVFPAKIDRKSGILYRMLYMIHPLTGRTKSIFGLVARLPGTGYLVPSRPSRQVERRLEPGDEVLVVGDSDGLQTAESGTVGAIADSEDIDRFRVTTRSRLSLVLRSIGGAIRSSLVGFVTLFLAAVIVVAGVMTGAY